MAFLYGTFSLYTILRAASVYLELLEIASNVSAMGSELLEGPTKTAGIAADVVLAFLIVTGSISVIYFILTAHRRYT
jgi:hypothetical protein